MQVQIKNLDKFLEKKSIFKMKKYLANVFLSLSANYLSLYWHKKYIIKLKPRKTLLFCLFFNQSKYQHKILCEYIYKKLANKYIWLFKTFINAYIFFNLKSNRILQLYMDYCRLNSMTIKNR